jgi:hemoglobin
MTMPDPKRIVTTEARRTRRNALNVLYASVLSVSPWLISVCLVAILIGCGGGPPESKNKDFFTSGNREADQRADQRMAQQQELTGGTNNGGETTTKSQAVLATEKKPLYDRLGGQKGISLIVDDFMNRALADPRVNWDRIGVKRGGLTIHRDDSMTWNSDAEHMKALKIHMVQFLSLATGGPATYTGKEIKSAHEGMHISNPEFDAVVGDLQATLENLQIASKEQKELLSIVESTREQIVEER